jgi:hypothetical protein
VRLDVATVVPVPSSVSAAWTALMKSLPAIRGPLEKVAASMLDPLFEKEKEIKDKIQAPIEEAAAKGMDAAEAKLQELFAQHMPVRRTHSQGERSNERGTKSERWSGTVTHTVQLCCILAFFLYSRCSLPPLRLSCT